mgnify:CR=1 FL=1
MLCSVILDIEPLLVLIYGLKYPLHGYLHTLLLSIPVGIAVGYVMYLLENIFKPLYRILLLEVSKSYTKKVFIASGIIGTASHVLLDSPLYHDIKPLYPLITNPLYNPQLTPIIYSICIYLGLLGLALYIILILFRT